MTFRSSLLVCWLVGMLGAVFANLNSMDVLLDLSRNHPEDFADQIRSLNTAALIPDDIEKIGVEGSVSPRAGEVLPMVFMHGMGDSCFNRGMSNIAEESGKYMGVYSVCIPTGNTRTTDTINGFLLNMDASVDVMAQAVHADPNLAKGFNCVGLSQGNNLCSGYIRKYNSQGPAVGTHLSIHGPLVGVAAIPDCMNTGPVCVSLSDALAKLAFKPAVQEHLFQANYFRDPRSVNTTEYISNSQMGAWLGEGTTDSEWTADQKNNFGLTQKYATIKALGDTVVVPNEAEWWGAYAPDFKTLLTMKDTEWYLQDTFGLRSADEAGKLYFGTTKGDHLDFTTEQLYAWLDEYLV